MVNWWFRLVVWIPRIPYERDCCLGIPLWLLIGGAKRGTSFPNPESGLAWLRDLHLSSGLVVPHRRPAQWRSRVPRGPSVRASAIKPHSPGPMSSATRIAYCSWTRRTLSPWTSLLWRKPEKVCRLRWDSIICWTGSVHLRFSTSGIPKVTWRRWFPKKRRRGTTKITKRSSRCLFDWQPLRHFSMVSSVWSPAWFVGCFYIAGYTTQLYGDYGKIANEVELASLSIRYFPFRGCRIFHVILHQQVFTKNSGGLLCKLSSQDFCHHLVVNPFEFRFSFCVLVE